MITLTFLRTWFRWALGTAAVLFADWIVVRDWVWRAGIAGLVTLVFVVVTAGLWGDWRRARHGGAGYHYSIYDDRD